MHATTIKVYDETKTMLAQFKEHKHESYDEVVRKLVYIAKTAKKNPRLSSKTVKDIEEARKRYKKGDVYSEEHVAKMLGIK